LDGSILRGRFFPGERRGAILFCAGNSGNLSSHLEYLRMARRTGYSVLGFDYRGFGASDGVADLRHLVDDVKAALGWLATRLHDEPVALFGVSIGAASAFAAAAAVSDERHGRRVDAVICEGLSDVEDMLAGLFSQGSFGPLRVDRLDRPDGRVEPRVRTRIGRFRLPTGLARAVARHFCASYPFAGKRPGALAASLDETPVFVVHGVDDELLPFEAALDIFARLREPRRLWIVPGAGHAQEPALSHGAEYAVQIASFLADAFDSGSIRVAGARRVPSRLVTTATGGTLAQRVVADPAETVEPPAADLCTELEVHTLASDGFPRSDDDELSSAYRGGGYRDAFRRLVQAAGAMDYGALDREISSYLELPRRMPFDLLVSTYCLRTAMAARGLVPGWPRPRAEVAGRAAQRFRELWHAHPERLPCADPSSPLRWIEAQEEFGR